MTRAVSRREMLLGSAGALVATTFGCSERTPETIDALVLEDGAICEPTRADLKGPFFEPGAPMRMAIADVGEPGERLLLNGRIFGTDCAAPLAGVVIDVWQADREGRYYPAAQTYRLRGQSITDSSGMFRLETIRPGNYLQGTGYRPAHIHFTFTRAGYRTVTTQVYFAGDPYLAPADSCGACGSNDQSRIVALTGGAASGWMGDLRVVLVSA